jgi:hypothetical protein
LDRKFYFGPPDYSLRVDFLSQWSRDLEPAAQLSCSEIASVAAQTEAFSFAYLRELCNSSLVRWMVEQNDRRMNEVMQSMRAILRRLSEPEAPKGESSAAAHQ